VLAGRIRRPGRVKPEGKSKVLAPQGLKVYGLTPASIWRALKRQPPSFWFVSVYLLFEYVRPQNIYDAINGPPYSLGAIILALLSFLLERRRLRVGMPEILLAIFSLVVLASSIAAFRPSVSFSYDNISVYFSWVLIYLLIANAVDTEERFFIFVLAFLLYSFKMSQHATHSWAADGFAFRRWGATGAPGWFHNSGEFGIQMCVFLPLVVAFVLALQKYWPRWGRWAAWGVAATAITGIVASSSRGALVGLAVVSLWLTLKSRHKIRAVIAVVAFGWAVYTIVPAEQKKRFERAGEDRTSVSRTTNWKDGIEIMQRYPVLGIGYANWRQYHYFMYGSELLSHNIFIEAGSELGLTGLASFLTLIWCTFQINRRTRRIAGKFGGKGEFMFRMAQGLDGALVGFIASGCFVTVLYYPYFWINFAMTVALNNAATGAFPEKRPTPSIVGSVHGRGGLRRIGPVVKAEIT
jgi:O-antigen ligase